MRQVANVLPKGAYVEQAVAVAKKELALECDYRNEMDAQARFRQLMHSALPALHRPASRPGCCALQRSAWECQTRFHSATMRPLAPWHCLPQATQT